MSGILPELRYRVERSLWLAAVSGVHPFFDSRIRSEIPTGDLNVLVLCVYRRRNADVVMTHVAAAERYRWEVRLWALDEIHPDLASHSCGVGAGAKFVLLNSLLSTNPFADFDWILVLDDDVAVHRGSLSAFVGLAQKTALSLAQPAHSFGRYRSFRVNCCHPLSVARLTTYVEIGPLFAVNRAWAKRILPFPEEFQMGWGLDVVWSGLVMEGARLGVIDWVTLNHLSPLAKDYNRSPEYQRMLQVLHNAGHNSLREIQKTLAVWRPWQEHPPWIEYA
jgi:hypothetical protein